LVNDYIAPPVAVDPWTQVVDQQASVTDMPGMSTSTSQEHQWPKLLSPPPPSSDPWEPPPTEEGSGVIGWILFFIVLVLIGVAGWQYEWILEQVQSWFG
jgi:hypothetical protein